jgi:uncharacterized integral membrane protein (TIGR00698 family)
MIDWLVLICVVGIFFLTVSAPIALIIGLAIAVFATTEKAKSGLAKYSKMTGILLKTAIVGLGFGISLDKALEVSGEGFWLTLSTILSVLLLGYIGSKLLLKDNKTGVLISSGTAICGGSAIAAIAPTIKANQNQIGIALGVVFMLNAIALLLFPYLGEVLGMSSQQFGLWAAIAIHDTSSVVGAASAFSPEALEIATTVKLARALWIIPLSLAFSYLFKGSGRPKVPVFILLFVLAILVNQYLALPTQLSDAIRFGSKRLMVVAILFIGFSFSIEKIKSMGLKPLILAILLWLFVSVGSAIWILQ